MKILGAILFTVLLISAFAVAWPLACAVNLILIPFTSWDDACHAVMTFLLGIERLTEKISRRRVPTGSTKTTKEKSK